MRARRLRGSGGCVADTVSYHLTPLLMIWGADQIVVNRDDFVSRYWNTNFSREEVLKRII